MKYTKLGLLTLYLIGLARLEAMPVEQALVKTVVILRRSRKLDCKGCAALFALRFRRKDWYGNTCESQRNRTQSSDREGFRHEGAASCSELYGENAQRRKFRTAMLDGGNHHRATPKRWCRPQKVWQLVQLHCGVRNLAQDGRDYQA